MKRFVVLLLMTMLLWGCGATPVYESVVDVYSGSEPSPGEVYVSLPKTAAALTSTMDSRKQLYFCDGYTLSVQTLAGGNLDRSLREITGFGKGQMTVMETLRDGLRCVSCVWTSLGEQGEQVGRLVLLDDGNYHYAVTVMADAHKAGELTTEWEKLLGCVTVLRTGS